MRKEVKLMYECCSCGELHDHEDEALDCCAPEISERWICPECGKAHDTESAAENCCPGGDAVTCPSCMRDHGSGSLGYAAVTISGHCDTCNPFFTVEQQLAIEDLHWQATGKTERLNA